MFPLNPSFLAQVMFKSFFKSQPIKTSTGKAAALANASQKALAIAKMRTEFLVYQAPLSLSLSSL